jgi:plasmid stabilization system protein ParE
VNIRFGDEARREFLDAISYYEGAGVGLGRRFKEEVDRCVLWIADHPEPYHMRVGLYRRVNLRVFPYHIPFVVREQTLWILAVAHASRKPQYWISRAGEVS